MTHCLILKIKMKWEEITCLKNNSNNLKIIFIVPFIGKSYEKYEQKCSWQ